VALRFFAGSVIGVAGLYATLAGGGLAALLIPVTSFFLGGAVAGAGVRSVSEWRSFSRAFLQFCQSSRRKRCLDQQWRLR